MLEHQGLGDSIAEVEVRWGRPARGLAAPGREPELVNQFDQDDLFVEMTFLRSLEQHGFELSIRQAGIDFANSGYRLWHANRAGRDNLRAGIAPPDSGHPRFSRHADDIDYRIEADFSGLIAPGLPGTAVEPGEVFGRPVDYGDGLYGGIYAEAFFELEGDLAADRGEVPTGSSPPALLLHHSLPGRPRQGSPDGSPRLDRRASRG